MSAVLDYVRGKDPRFNNVSDDELSAYVAKKDPRFLQNEEFRTEVLRLNPEKRFGPFGKPSTMLPSDVPTEPKPSFGRLTIPSEEPLIPVDEQIQAVNLEPGVLAPMMLNVASEQLKREAVELSGKESERQRLAFEEALKIAPNDPVFRGELTKAYKAAKEAQGVGIVDKSITSLPEAVHKPLPFLPDFPRLTSEDVQKSLGVGTTAGGIISGTQNAVGDLAEFFMTPIGVATLGMGAMPRAAQRAVSAAFALQMTASLPEQATALVEAIKAKDVEGTTRGLVGLGFTVPFIAGAGKHALGPERFGEPTMTPATRILAQSIERATKSFNLPKDLSDRMAVNLWSRVNDQRLGDFESTLRDAERIAQDQTLPEDMRSKAVEVRDRLTGDLLVESEMAFQESRESQESVRNHGVALWKETIKEFSDSEIRKAISNPEKVGEQAPFLKEAAEQIAMERGIDLKESAPTEAPVESGRREATLETLGLPDPNAGLLPESPPKPGAEMTPGEFFDASTQPSSAASDIIQIAELVSRSREQDVTGSSVTQRTVPGASPIPSTRAAAIRKAHEMQIKLAFRSGNPVNADAVKKYGIAVPKDYALQGDNYVKQSAPTEARVTPTEAAPPESLPPGAPSSPEAVTAAVPESKAVTPKPPANEVVGTLPAESQVSITEKGESNAIPKRETEAVHVDEASQDRQEMGAQVREQAPAVEETKAEDEKLHEVGPGIAGLGAAARSEFEKAGLTKTSLHRAQIEKEAADIGLPSPIAPIRKSHPEAFDRAMQRIDEAAAQNRDAIQELIDRKAAEIAEEKATPLSDEETMMLAYHRMDLLNERDRLTREIDEASAAGNFQQFADLKGQKQVILNQLADTGDLNLVLGSESGRSLSARKAFVTDRLELGEMLGSAKQTLGRSLNQREIEELERIYDESEKATAESERVIAKREREIRDAEFADVFKDHLAEEASAPRYSKRVIEVAEAFLARMDKAADAAEARIRARMRTMSSGLDPTWIPDLAIVGARLITRGIVEAAKWTDEMVNKFGEWVRPYLADVRRAAEQYEDSEVDAFLGTPSGRGATKSQVKGASGGRAAKDDIARLQARLASKASQGLSKDINPIVQRLGRILIEQGVRDRDTLVDGLQSILNDFFPGIAKEEVADAYAGYGDFKPLRKDDISRIARDLRGQLQQTAKLRDIQAKVPVQKTGLERREPSDEERKLIKLVEDAKRKYGVVVTDPATQLKSALDARKTYYRHRIDDLTAQINARQKFIKQRAPTPTDPELEALKAESAELTKEFNEIFTPPELTDQQRIERSIKAQERAIERNKQRIKEGKFWPDAAPEAPTNDKLEALRAENQALQKTIDYARALYEGKEHGADLANRLLEERVARSIADYQRRIATGDFSPRHKPARDISQFPDVMAAKARERKAREAYQHIKARHEYDASSKARKVYDNLKDGINLSRQLLTSWDISAPGRQGLFLSVSHPKLAWKAAKAMIRSIRSPQQAREINESIHLRPNARNGIYDKMGLYLAPLERGTPAGMEEAKMLGEFTAVGRLGQKIPGLQRSQYGYVTYLNMIRADAADLFYDNLMKGRTPAKEELEAVGNFINVATGRGDLGKVAAAGELMATVFFAPRLVASRFQLLAGQPFYKGSGRTRAMVAKEYGKFLTAMAAFYGLGILAGGTVETDPRSSDAFKLRFGNTRLDPLAGLAQVTRISANTLSAAANFAAKNAFGSNVTDGDVLKASGEMQYLGEAKYGEKSYFDQIASFLRSKLAPAPGMFIDALSQKNIVGEDVTASSMFWNAITPLAYKDVFDIMREHGVPAGTAMEMLSILGIGVQQYEPYQGSGRARSRSR